MVIFAADELGDGTFGHLFLGAAGPAAYFWHTEVPRKVWPHSESGGRTWPAPPPKAIAHPFFGHFAADELGDGTVGRLFLGTAVPVAFFWDTEAPRKVLPHSESSGRTWPAPPPKAIAHPFFGHFCGGPTWGRDLRVLIFGCGSARGLFLAHGGPSQSLAPF